MSINALYVYVPTTFTVTAPCTIEQFVEGPSGTFTVVPRPVSGQFTLGRGAYRYATGVTLAPVGNVGEAAGRSGETIGFVITPMGVKTTGPDLAVQAAAAALGVSSDSLSAFLMNAEPAVTLAPTAAQHARH